MPGPGPGGPPGVRAKDLQTVKLLASKDQYFRGDVLPFIILYVADLALAGYFATRYEW